MTFRAGPGNKGIRSRKPWAYRLCLLLLLLAPLAILLNACAGRSSQGDGDSGYTGAANHDSLTGAWLAHGGVTIGEAPLDTIQPVVLSDEPIVKLPVGPEGHPSLKELESLCETALALAGQGELDLAQDHLYTLQEQVNLPLPTGVDSLYASHLRSLDRRVWLLGGILAEQNAFAGNPAAADSLLTANYGRLAMSDFPDSLVPATGARLASITADLMKVENQAVRKWENYFTGRGRRNFQFWLDRKTAA